MTQPTVKTPAEQLALMQWLKCASCGGRGWIYSTVGGHPTLSYATEPCSSCQDQDIATGLDLSGLTEWCPFRWPLSPRSHPEECPCQGLNRIPKRHDVLEAVLERIDVSGPTWSRFVQHLYRGLSLRDAAIDALYEALVAKGLVAKGLVEEG